MSLSEIDLRTGKLLQDLPLVRDAYVDSELLYLEDEDGLDVRSGTADRSGFEHLVSRLAMARCSSS